jgi:hypothetical protein
MAERRGLHVTGPCGVGKSWLSCALAQKACREGYTIHYARVPRLFTDLDLAHGDGRFARLFRMLVRVDLLVLDDWGPDRLSGQPAARSDGDRRGSSRARLLADHQPTPARYRGSLRYSLFLRNDRQRHTARRVPMIVGCVVETNAGSIAIG